MQPHEAAQHPGDQRTDSTVQRDKQKIPQSSEIVRLPAAIRTASRSCRPVAGLDAQTSDRAVRDPGLVFAQAGHWRDAGAVLATAMSAAPASLKGEVAAALESAAPYSEAAAANLAFASLSADGIPRDIGRARARANA